jgi:hypothetical protein
MMERRPWTLRRFRRQLPRRFRDELPQPPLPSLPLPPATPSQDAVMADSQGEADNDAGIGGSVRNICRRTSQFFTTQRNKFGLFRRYWSNSPPSHDPDGNVTPECLSDVPDSVQPAVSRDTFYPYPNRSSFQLGDWYWNGGAQKSHASFKDLVNIVGDPEFSPSDVRRVRWDDIDSKLASNDGWTDEEDTGWIRTPVNIEVPFQHRRHVPATSDSVPRDFLVADFHHRSLVSVMREKISNPADMEGFHYEPYDLKWKSQPSSDPISVHGELFTSPAFMDAHQEVQNLPAEPGCDRPRVVLALMFWSDATHLTSFGEAKLWPLYMYFGNESKYRRCKPTQNLGNHVAYFQAVRYIFCLEYWKY